MKQQFLLPVILVLAASLRLVGLDKAPNSLYWEEAALGYDAYSIWETGKDYHGNSWPVVAFESFGDYKPSGYFYAAAPFVGILGLNNWSIRLPSAIAGIISVYLVYLIGRNLFKDRQVGLGAAFTLAILPWQIQFSRAAFEVNLAVMWLLLGIWLLLKANMKLWLIMPSVLAFVAAAYTYHGLRVTGPLIALTLILFEAKKFIKSKWLYGGGILAILLMLPLVINLTNKSVSQRFQETSLFSTSQAVQITNQLRQEDGNSVVSRLIHHRYVYWGKEIINGMLRHFSPGFLFLNGDGNQRHQTGVTALLYLWQLIPIGIACLTINKQHRRSWLFLATWMAWAALPVALTNVTPHTLRFLSAAPVFAIISGYGLKKIFEYKKRWLSLSLSFLIGIQLIGYVFDYHTSYSLRSEFEWQVGYQQLVEYVNKIETRYPIIQVTRAYGRPSIYFLYYSKFNPEVIQSLDEELSKDQGELLAYGKYRFGPIDLNIPGLAISETQLPRGELIQVINAADNRPVFYIYEI